MLELRCTCGWAVTESTKDDLFVQAKAHVVTCEDRRGEPLDDGALRALVAQMAREVGPPPAR